MRTLTPELSLPAVSRSVMLEDDDGERDLLRRVRSGDRRAAEELVERTYQTTFIALVRLTHGQRDLAADLTQETYRKAWEALPGFDGRSRLATWLYRIAYNTFLNHVRRKDLFVPLEAAAEPVQDGPAPQEDLLVREERDRVRKAVGELPEDLRFAVTAHFWGEVSVKEIARISSLTSMGVRKRLYRAFTALGTALHTRHTS